MKLVPLLLLSTLFAATVAQAATSDTTTFAVTVPFEGSVLSSKDLTAGTSNTIPVCYTANAPATLTITSTMTSGANFNYPITLKPATGEGVGTIVSDTAVDVIANSNSYGLVCDGTVASAVAFKYVFDAPDGSTMATTGGKAAGVYSTDVTVSIAAK